MTNPEDEEDVYYSWKQSTVRCQAAMRWRSWTRRRTEEGRGSTRMRGPAGAMAGPPLPQPRPEPPPQLLAAAPPSQLVAPWGPPPPQPQPGPPLPWGMPPSQLAPYSGGAPPPPQQQMMPQQMMQQFPPPTPWAFPQQQQPRQTPRKRPTSQSRLQSPNDSDSSRRPRRPNTNDFAK